MLSSKQVTTGNDKMVKLPTHDKYNRVIYHNNTLQHGRDTIKDMKINTLNNKFINSTFFLAFVYVQVHTSNGTTKKFSQGTTPPLKSFSVFKSETFHF